MLYAIVAIIALILDQALKYWTTTHIVLNTGTKKLIPGVIYLTNYHNEGAAFSILSGARWLFVALCIVFVIVVVYCLAVGVIKGRAARWAAVIVLAGAVGNCIDRILNGFVVDMFVFEFVDFAVFNLADVYITCGAVVFCICVILDKTELGSPKKAAAGAPAGKGKAVPAAKAGAASPAASAPNAGGQKDSALAAFLKKPAPEKGRLDAPRSHSTPVSAPAVDPNDPFAEWEKRAAESRRAEERERERINADPFADARTRPAAEPARPTPSAEPAHKPAPKAEPVKPDAKLSAAIDEMSFDLEDILAEFKD